MAVAHTYVYTDLLRQTKKSGLASYMTDMWYSVTDGWEQFKLQLKWKLETGQKFAIHVRKTLAEIREKREKLRVKKSFKSG